MNQIGVAGAGRTPAALAAVLCLIAGALCPAPGAAEPKRGGTLAVVAPGGLRHLNPAVQSGAPAAIGAQLFAGLVRVDANFELRPYLAERWEVSADGLSYTFHLARNARFHDGAPVTSADVAFSLAVVRAHHPFGRAMFDPVDSVRTPDPHTAVIVLRQPHPALMQALVAPLMPVIPKHVFGDGRDPATHPANAAPVGSGPFRFGQWARGRHAILERNRDFFVEGRPLLDRIVVRFVNEPSLRLLAVAKGEADYYPFASLRPGELARAARNPALRVSERGYAALGPLNYLEFNLGKPPFGDLRVRRAVAYAIDRAFMLDTLYGGRSRAADGPLHSASPFHARGPDPYPADLGRAAALLDAAGYAPDVRGVRFAATLDYPPLHAHSLRVGAHYIRSQLARVGIAVTLRAPGDLAGWAARIASGDYALTMNTHWTYPDPVIGVHRAYRCANIRNIVWANTQGYCNRRVEALLDEAGSTPDTARRRALYGQFQRIVNAELPLYFINEEPYVTVSGRAVMDLPETPWGAMQPLDGVWLDR